MSIEFFERAGIILFQGLDDDQVADLLRQAQPRTIAADIGIFSAGTPAQQFHVLLSGCVKLVQYTASGERIIVQYVRPGESFGMPALLGRHYRADALAVTQCTALQWPSHVIRELISKHPRAALNAMRDYETRLEGLEGRLRNLSRGRVEQRIAHVLLDLHGRFGRLVSGGTEISFPLSRQDLADLSGTTLHTVSRVLGTWDEQGHIKRGWRRIIIRDAAGLRMIAQQGTSAGATAAPGRQRARRRQNATSLLKRKDGMR